MCRDTLEVTGAVPAAVTSAPNDSLVPPSAASAGTSEPVTWKISVPLM
jgi:hypothetical protein